MQALKTLCYLALNSVFSFIPSRLYNILSLKNPLLRAMVQNRGLKNLNRRQAALGFRGLWIKDESSMAQSEEALLRRLINCYNAMKSAQKQVEEAYQPAHDWGRALATEWREAACWFKEGKLDKIDKFFRNFFRNQGITGFWGANRMFSRFISQGYLEGKVREWQMMEHFQTWQALFPSLSSQALDAPRIGNPWGYDYGGALLIEPMFEYHFHAECFKRWLLDLPGSTVVEIGGGFGGLAYQLLKQAPEIKYIGLDLPENLIIQAYYLLTAFPKKSALFYGEYPAALSREILGRYDIVLLPNFVLPHLPAGHANLIANVRSLSEMASGTIKEYYKQIDRLRAAFYFHENLNAPRGDAFHGIPAARFPKLSNYRLVYSAESRWLKYNAASAYPCQEYLYKTRVL